MPSSLSSLTDNLAVGLPKSKCEDWNSWLECETAKNGLLVFKCPECNKNDDKAFEDSLAKKIAINRMGFFSKLAMKGITDADYKHVKRVRKDSVIQNLGGYHGLFV